MHTRRLSSRLQRGQVLLLTLLLVVGVGVTLFVNGASSEVTRLVNAEAGTRTALAQAKEALIARAVTDSNRPGSMPCPDTNDDGSAELLSGNHCPSYIGRLPWRTLGLPDLRDDSGERLWYALSPRFRDDNSVQINSDTKGSLTVYSGTTAVTLNKTFSAANTDVIAVIFAPGLALSAQIRDTSTAACATTGTTIAHNLCAANYLESLSSVNNATAPDPTTAVGTYIALRTTLSSNDTVPFNDRVATVRTAELMPLVERRVANELRDVLSDYFGKMLLAIPIDCPAGCYPWADSNNDGTSDGGQNRGRLPVIASPHTWSKYISAITKANPGVITTTFPHGFQKAQQIYLSGIGGMTELNNRLLTATIIEEPDARPATRFSIGVDTKAYTTYTSGGTVGPALIHPTTKVVYTTPPLPTYFQPNNWASVLYYAVGRNALQNFFIPCTSCTAPPPPLGTLSISGTSGYAVIVITPGSTNANRPSTNWSDYVDDAANRDANDAFVTPTSKALDRDRLFTIADFAPPASCGPNAQALIRNAPCHTTGTSVKPVCQQAANNLAACTCSNSASPSWARVMLDVPCRNTLNPPNCKTAVAQLQSCNG